MTQGINAVNKRVDTPPSVLAVRVRITCRSLIPATLPGQCLLLPTRLPGAESLLVFFCFFFFLSQAVIPVVVAAIIFVVCFCSCVRRSVSFSSFLLLLFFIVVYYVCLFVCPSVVLCLCSSMFVCLPSTLRSVSTAWATGARVGTHSPRSGHRGYAL